MKNFFRKAFTRQLTAISMHPTSGQHGYSNPNPYTIFNATHDDDDTSTASTHHTMTTTTVPPVGSTIGGSTLTPEVTSALAQISHTQNALMMQMAALSVVPQQHPPNQITIPTGNQFSRGGGYRGQGGSGYHGQRGGTYGGHEDVDHLPRQRRIQTYLWSAVNLHHFLVEERNAGTTKSC